MQGSSRALTAAVLSLVILHPIAWTQQTDEPGPEGAHAQRTGTLAGHGFVPTSFVKDPFVRTYLRTGLGFGLTPELSSPPVTINGQTITGVKGSLLFALMDVEFQYAIREWVAVRAGVSVVGRLADETRPLLTQGVTLYSGFELGWLFRLTETDRLSLSGSLVIRNSSLTDIYLKRFIEGIIQDGQVSPDNDLVENTPTLQGGGGLSCAYAISRLVGVTATGSVFYGESLDRTAADEISYVLAASLDFNFGSNGGPPIGFVAGVRTASTPDLGGTTSESAHAFFGRIAYTGSHEFALGLDLAYDVYPVRNMDDKPGFTSAVVEIRLFF